TAQRTMYAYEQALLRLQSDWLDAVRGPEVSADTPRRGPDPNSYRAWMSLRRGAGAPVAGPAFSILTPVFNPDSRFLEDCIRSVRAQTYRNWQLVLVNVSSEPHVAPICRRFSLIDERLTVIAAENAGIAVNTTIAAHNAAGEWLVFLDHDDELAPHALAAVAQVIADVPDVDFIYSDEDKLDDDDERVDPFFKPDWSPDLLRMVNYIGHLVAVRRSLFDAVGGLRPGFDGAQDFDFLLRATCRAQRIVHIPDVLYHWRRHANSTAVDVRVKPDAHGAGRRALQAFVDDLTPGAWVDLGSGPTTHRLRYPLRIEQLSVIIPFRDRPEVTDACLRSLPAYFNELPYEVLLVSNHSQEEKTFAMMERWEREYDFVRCLRYDQPFNFQALNNWAVRQAEGSLLLFLNNDTEALHDKWIDGLAENAQRAEVGVVGPRLFYPNGLVQHAGVALGIGGFAEHPWAGLHPDSWTVACRSYWVSNFL
ncbi:MAG: glycosyltransferase family 2 protein, partial [bacterium]